MRDVWGRGLEYSLPVIYSRISIILHFELVKSFCEQGPYVTMQNYVKILALRVRTPVF